MRGVFCPRRAVNDLMFVKVRDVPIMFAVEKEALDFSYLLYLGQQLANIDLLVGENLYLYPFRPIRESGVGVVANPTKTHKEKPCVRRKGGDFFVCPKIWV